MAAGWRGRLGAPAVTLLLLLAVASAAADVPPANDAGKGEAATPQDRPSGPPATPPEAAKKGEPPPPKNLETLEPGEAIGLLGKEVRDAAGQDMGM
ncbi:MAG TPA: hypothetical protein VN681_04855, partial [Stellaceae bacterium]|nr:hypothetical protein [Stellaceae bacterium]